MKIAIVGAGKLGTTVAEALLGGNHSVTVIDKNEKTLQKLSSQMDVMTIPSNGKKISVMKEIHISSYDFLLACTDRDEKNIVIASFAKKLGCSKVIARVRDPEHVNQMDFIRDAMSIDYMVNPDMSITNEIYKYLVEKYTLSNGIFSSGKVSILECRASKIHGIVNRKISELGSVLPNMLVVGIDRHGKVIIPHGSDSIEKQDHVYIIGEKKAIASLNDTVHEKGKYTDLQKVMIIGGGKTGLFLATKLSDFGIAVKIIEKNRDRCFYLSERLQDVMILHGDATDQSLLEEENLDGMDALVTATGYDEDNLLLALLAKQRGVEDVIAKVSRGIYSSMISAMGVDMALNPLDITASNILRIMQDTKRILSNEIIQGQAEVIEIYAEEGMRLCSRPLRSLKLPDGVLVGAIHRGTEILIPDGHTTIQNGDRVIIICLLSELADLERLTTAKAKADFLR